MSYRKPYSFLQKAIILSLAASFMSFGMQQSNNIFHLSLSVKQAHLNFQQQSDSCCKECGKENCTCCSRHVEKKTNNSDNCTCQVSKDMDDRPLLAPCKLKVPCYHLCQILVIVFADPLSQNSSLLKFESLTKSYILLKVKHSTVLLI